MSEQQSLRQSPDTHCESPKPIRTVSRSHVPRQNHLLAALPYAEYQRLLPHLEPVSLGVGSTLSGTSERQSHLYFPVAGLVSRFHLMENGKVAGFAITGHEGAIGIASFLGGMSMLNQTVVLSAGSAYRLRDDIVSAEFRRGGELPRLMLRYTAALIAQIAQTTVCNRFHSTEQQFCRFILACLDRLPSRELAVTQHLIADMLGVRRESVSAAASRLQKAGAIQYRRGHIAVIDRKPLEMLACECYALDRSVYESLVGPKCIVDDARAKGGSGSALRR